MSKIKSSTSPIGSARPPLDSVEPRRFDSAHPIRGRNEDSHEAGGLESIARPDEEAQDQEGLQRHAEELAEQLRTRRQQLDRREAQLNTQLARSEHEIRLARLWIQDREAELCVESNQLEDRQNEIEQRVASFSAAELASRRDLDERQAQLATLENDIQQRETRLADFQERLQQQQSWLSEEAQRIKSSEQQAANEKRSLIEALETQREQLAAAEVLLQQQGEAAKSQLSRLQVQLENERKDLADRQQEFLSRRQDAASEIAEQRRQLERRSASLDEKQQLFQGMHEKVQAFHHEALEMRLVGEQIWARLNSTTDSIVLADLAREVRSKLADHHRTSEQHQSESKEELREIAVRLAAKENEIRKKRADAQAWLERRQHEIEEQAARLVAREQELNRQQRQYFAERESWEDERQQSLARIRRLLRDDEAESLPATHTG